MLLRHEQTTYILVRSFNSRVTTTQPYPQINRNYSLFPRPSPLSAHYTRGGFCACGQLSTCITVHMRKTRPAYNERLAGKAWERGYINYIYRAFHKRYYLTYHRIMKVLLYTLYHTLINTISLQFGCLYSLQQATGKSERLLYFLVRSLDIYYIQQKQAELLQPYSELIYGSH